MAAAASLRIAPIGAAGSSGGPERADGPLERITAAAKLGVDLVLLPQLSFSRYFPAGRDRAALELGERLPSREMSSAIRAAGESHLAASVYECVGEGVFYSCGQIARLGDGTLLTERQRVVEAAPGRYEQMFISPGFGPRSVAKLPWGGTGLLVGADVRSVSAWTELASAGARLVVASVSEPAEQWQGTRTAAAGLATVNGMAVALVNREPSEDESDFAGGQLVADPSGTELAPDGDGIYELSIGSKGTGHE